MIKVYGIKTCGTVKKARKWLDENDVSYEWVDFRETPPTAAQVASWVAAFGFKPMRNTSGGAYRKLPKEERAKWGTEEWLPRLQADFMLLKRPILEIDGHPKAVGFKEAVYEGLFA